MKISNIYSKFETIDKFLGESLYNIVTNVLDCNIMVSMFEFQSYYYIHFQTKTFGKGMNSLILPAIG